MKTKTLSILILLFAFTIANTFAQIPNSGFENWTEVGNHMTPNGWQTSRDPLVTNFYPTTRDNSHYPAAVGNYSIRIENNTSLLPGFSALGIAETGNILGAVPAFSITGHPTSLTGYYKFAPINGDTLWITVVLSQGGSLISQGQFLSSVSVTNWTSFNIPLSTYISADSAFIILSSFLANGPGQFPHGNSVLNVDNLNFDNLITGISDVSDLNPISIYPNPFSSTTTLQTEILLKNATLTVFNYFGQTVKEIKNISGQTITLQRDNLQSGMYFIRLTQGNKTLAEQKLVIIGN